MLEIKALGLRLGLRAQILIKNTKTLHKAMDQLWSKRSRIAYKRKEEKMGKISHNWLVLI
jgi:hypothetical protein